jgi:hypothetical protein
MGMGDQYARQRQSEFDQGYAAAHRGGAAPSFGGRTPTERREDRRVGRLWGLIGGASAAVAVVAALALGTLAIALAGLPLCLVCGAAASARTGGPWTGVVATQWGFVL